MLKKTGPKWSAFPKIIWKRKVLLCKTTYVIYSNMTEMDELFFSILACKFHVHVGVLLAFNGYWCTTQWIGLSDCSIVFLCQGDKRAWRKFILTTLNKSDDHVTKLSSKQPSSSFEKELASFISSDQ